jgi:hypothetical protein
MMSRAGTPACLIASMTWFSTSGARPKYVWEHQTMYFATDPVALDKIGLRAIDAKRAAVGMASIALSKPEHIEFAGLLGLGVFDDNKIDLKRFDLA